LRDQNAKTRLEHTLVQVQQSEAKVAAQELEMDKAGKEECKSGIVARLQEIFDLKKAREGEYADAEKKFKAAESEYNKNKRMLERAEEEHINLVQELKRSNESRKKNKKAAAKFEEEIENLKGLPENHQKDITRYVLYPIIRLAFRIQSKGGFRGLDSRVLDSRFGSLSIRKFLWFGF